MKDEGRRTRAGPAALPLPYFVLRLARGWAVPAAGLWLVAGCQARSDPVAKLYNVHPAQRAAAAGQLARRRAPEAIRLLIERLQDEDATVRMIVAVHLRQITGQDFGFRHDGPKAARREAVARWRAWRRAAMGAPSATQPAESDDGRSAK